MWRPVLDEMRDRIRQALASARVGVLSAPLAQGSWSQPVRIRLEGLAVVCALPQGSDLPWLLEQNPCVILVVLRDQEERLAWVQVRGRAEVQGEQVLLQPTRIDLVVEQSGLLVRETLDV